MLALTSCFPRRSKA